MRGLAGLLLLITAAAQGDKSSASAFRFETEKVRKTIDLKEITLGVRYDGPDPRDRIPSIRKPRIVAAKKATWLLANDRVLGVVVNGEARAYSLNVLEGHEMVNDVLGGVPIGPNY